MIPISAIVESLRPMPASIVRMDKQTPMLSWRGSMLRIVNLAKEFSIPGAVEDPTQAILVVVRPAGGDLFAHGRHRPRGLAAGGRRVGADDEHPHRRSSSDRSIASSTVSHR